MEGNAVNGEIGTYLQDWLISAAERTMAPDVAGEVIDDLKNDMRLSSFVPHPDIEPGEVTGEQQLVFNIDVKQPGGTFFEIDGQPYVPTASTGRCRSTAWMSGRSGWISSAIRSISMSIRSKSSRSSMRPAMMSAPLVPTMTATRNIRD